MLLLLNIPVALFPAGGLPLLAEIIPLRRRARVFSSRNITLGITVTICTFIFGRWLDNDLHFVSLRVSSWINVVMAIRPARAE